jgi:hypothetical protein
MARDFYEKEGENIDRVRKEYAEFKSNARD